MKSGLQSVSIPGREFIINQFNQGQTVTSDTAFLVQKVISAYKCQASHKHKVLDIGSGSGIICFMLASEFPEWEISGVEIQSTYHELALSNKDAFSEYYPANKLVFMNQDVRKASLEMYDLIVCNPPYYKVGEGNLSPEREKAIARHELFLNMPDLLEVIKKHLNGQAKAFILYPEKRTSELKQICDMNMLELFDYHIVPDTKINNRIILFEVKHADI